MMDRAIGELLNAFFNLDVSLSLVSYGDSDSDIEPEDTNSAKPAIST